MSASSTSGPPLSLASGDRLGPYEIVSPLGVGGMGEVYRARDTRLGRDVAIKLLPEAFTVDPERLARFEREARVLASLNHPHIAQIYGVEESAGVRALVLELVDGETLADRIRRGPLPASAAVDIAGQIADALDAAHEKGIVHRDLKPANIALTAEGAVKVLDFGLAKDASGAGARSDWHPPTMLAPTVSGMMLGTAPYMSPEQARGKTIDKRTDIWAFGCVLDQMLTNHRAFNGDTTSDTIVAILERQPDWTDVPSSPPAHVRHLVERCLEKYRSAACATSATRERCSTKGRRFPPVSRRHRKQAWRARAGSLPPSSCLPPSASPGPGFELSRRPDRLCRD